MQPDRTSMAPHLLHGTTLAAAEDLNLYEKLCQNSLLDSRGCDLRDCVRSGSARVQEEREELPDE